MIPVDLEEDEVTLEQDDNVLEQHLELTNLPTAVLDIGDDSDSDDEILSNRPCGKIAVGSSRL